MRNITFGLTGVTLIFIGIWGGTFLCYTVSRDYELAAILTSIMVVLIGLILILVYVCDV